MKGHHDGGKGAGRQRDVRRVECQAQFAPDMLGEECLRLLFTRLVGEPVLIVRQRAFADRRHEARQGQLVRVAEGEVRNAGIETPLAVARDE